MITDEEIIQHTPLVRAIIARYNIPHHMYDDVLQEGYLGLLHARDKFDSKYGTQFNTYARHWVRYYISKYLNTYTAIHNPLRYDKEIVTKTSGWQNLVDRESLRDLLITVNTLGEREQFIFNKVYLEECTLQEVGDMLGLSRQRVKQICDVVINKVTQSNT